MNKLSQLQQQAIKAAKNSNWEQAIEINTSILDSDPEDTGALNRMGLAQLQLGKTTLAKKTFKQVLEIDASNSIAQKNLTKIKNKQVQNGNIFSQEQFIEEPGKTKIIELHRLAGKDVVDALSVGQKCDLKSKKRFISIVADGKYIGSLPEDLSFRLTQLIDRGNKYECFIYSASCKSIKIFIKEITRSKKNENINSFPLSKESVAQINDVDEKFLLDEDVPMEIVSTDLDEGNDAKNIQPTED